MDNINSNYGILLNEKDIKLYRSYFLELTQLLGVKVLYRAPLKDKHWTSYAEIDSNYQSPEIVACIFNEYPDQQTMKKLGWVSELDKQSSIISVPYDLQGLQVGALFIVPSGIDNAKGRLFRVVRLSNIMIYPASMTCELVPEYENTYSPSLETHPIDSFNLLDEESMGSMYN